MGSLEADIRMEERRKKSRGENLEDRQMKRYMRSLKRKARKENQSQVRTPESTVAFTETLESKKQEVKNQKKTEIKTEKVTQAVKSKDESGQENKKEVSKPNESSKKEKDSSRTSEWVEEMNKINDQKSQEKKKEKKKQKQKQPAPSTSNENETLASSSPEFSPIVYWREPIPDVEILSLDSSNNAEISNTTKSPKSPDDELRRCLSLDTKTIWFDKSKCEDAEAKFQAKKSQEAKLSSTKVKKEDRKKSKPKNTNEKQAKVQEDTIREGYEPNDYGDKTLEDVLEDFRCDNERFRTQIIGLTQIIVNLQIRIGHLESTPTEEAFRKLSSESDEGVDMSELAYNKGQSSKCPFYADCVCNSDSDDTNTVISDESCSDINIQNSLNSGSEFEEFPPI